MKSFREYIDWAKETGYLKQTSLKGSGGRGGTTEKSDGERAVITWVDDRNQKTHSMIPPVQYKPAKDRRTLKKYVETFTDDVESNGGKVKKVEYGR